MAKVKHINKAKSKVREVGTIIPSRIIRELYERGYHDGRTGNVLRDFRASYRMGFRKAKLELAEEHKKASNVRYVPGKIKFKTKNRKNKS